MFMQKQKVCFLGFFPDYEYLFFREIENDTLDISFFNPIDITDTKKWFKKLPRYFKNKYHRKLIKKHIKKNTNTTFIFTEHRLVLQSVLNYLENAKNPDFRGVLLIRNPLNDNHKVRSLLPQLEKYDVNIFTFDKTDAERYGYRSYLQFASKLSQVSNIPITYDFSFVGRDKGRSKILNNLKNQLESMGYRCNFDIRSIDQPNISYIDYLKVSLSAKCMIEILQENQSGMTLRAIEAMLYGRKLLTNNANIEEEPLYDASEISVCSDNLNHEKIYQFMNITTRNLDIQTSIHSHESETVIKSIIESINQ